MSRLGTFKQSFKSARTEIKAFLRRQEWKEALIFLCFVLLAFGFWLMQSLQQAYEIEIQVPVKYKNIPPDIAFTQAPPDVISVKVKDKGSVLLNYSLGRSFSPLEADMKAQQQAGHLAVSQAEIESCIKKQLIATTSLIQFEPQAIDISYSKRAQKELPVVFNGSVQTAPGVKIAGEISIRPQTIQVYANNLILDTLRNVQTVFTEIKKSNKTIQRTLQLQPIPGTTFEPTSVSVTIPIEAYTDKTVEVPVVCTDVPPHYTIRMFPSVVKVSCSVPLSRFKQISANDFEIRIHFSDLEQNVTGTIPLHLNRKPEGVDVAHITPDKIEFILEQTH